MSSLKRISTKTIKNGFAIKISNYNETHVKYPANFLQSLKPKSQDSLLENFSFCRTRPLGLYYKQLFYNGPKPILADFVLYGIKNDLPYINSEGHKKTSSLIKKIAKTSVFFNKKGIGDKILPKKKPQEKAILSMSFGKDSLLSYGLAKEIGLPLECAFINDMEDYNPVELAQKKKIIKSFAKKEKEKIIFIQDNSDDIFDTAHLSRINEYLAGTNAMLSFTLTLLPLAYAHQARYIIFGNEKELDVCSYDKEKLKIFSSFDQSEQYMIKKNLFLKKLTSNNLVVTSLIKPLYNLAEIGILSKRYPHLIQYLMTCDGKKDGGRACGNCVSCAWTSLFGAAFNVDSKNFGLKKYLFEKKDLKKFVLFNPAINKISEKTKEAKEEQLLAFLLAYRNGGQGHLINLFAKNFLSLAEKKEKQLRKKFFGIHSLKTIPKHFHNKLLKIFNEELKPLQKIN